MFFTLVALGVFLIPAFSQTTRNEPLAVLQGRLIQAAGRGPAPKTSEKEYPLAGKTSWLHHTLQDERLGKRAVRMEGTFQRDGTFEVSRLYTVREGKLYRIRYFCELCNIEALEPGVCVCCQQPTELQEIPVTETM